MTTKTSPKKWIILGVAVCLLIAVTAIGASYYNNNFIADSLINLDVNPGVEITTNKSNKVLDVVATNPDGETILDSMHFKNAELKVAINAIIGSMVQKGFILDGEDSILVTIQNDDLTKSELLKNKILSAIDVSLSTNNVTASILNQTLADTTAANEFAKGNNISLGKAALVLNLIAKEATLDAAELAQMSIKNTISLMAEKGIDIHDIVYYDAGDGIKENIADTLVDSDKREPSNQNQQTVSSSSTNTTIITVDQAQDIALADAGIAAANATFLKAKLDYDDGIQVYEIEFYSGNLEYDYDINATTGAILSVDKDIENYTIPNNKQATTGASTNTTVITAEKAKEIALADAGVDAANATFVKTKLDYDDGIQVYEVKFYRGTTEYEYDINAVTGAIISSKTNL